MTTFATHNLHDETGTPTAFADVLFFTEAIPDRVRAVLDPLGYVVSPCRWQKDLVIAWKRGTFTPRRAGRYFPAHPGLAKVTPHRGTYEIVGSLNGQRAVLIVEHRINAAFPPFKRGESIFRPAMWRLHTRITLRRIRHHERKGRLVLAGGDLNTPHGVSGYQGALREAGTHFDRLGSTRPVEGVEVLSRKGSDHPRLRARVWDDAA